MSDVIEESTQPGAHAGPFAPLIDTTVRIVTWNLWWRWGPWRERAAAITATLAGVNADVLCLQEVWIDGDTSSAHQITAMLGYEHVVTGHRLVLADDDGVEVGFGNAIVSRWPITSHRVRELPGVEGADELRVGLLADIAGPRGVLQVTTTHLNWRYDHSAVRQAQVRAMCRLIDEAKPAIGRSFPPVLCGDFNAEVGSEEMRMLLGLAAVPVPKLVFHDAWALAGNDTAGLTWTRENRYAAAELEPDRRIDYVLVGWPKAGGAGNPVRCTVHGMAEVGGVLPSDHLAVVADLRY